MSKVIKCLTVLLAILLLPLFAAAEGENIILNSGFESGEYRWSKGASGEWRGSSVSVTEEKAYQGKTSAKIINQEMNAPYIKQQRLGLVPGATYKLSFMYYLEFGEEIGDGFCAELTFYKGESDTSEKAGTHTVVMDSPTNSQWHRQGSIFVFPENAEMFRIIFRMRGKGEVYIDDVAVTFEEADTFSFSVPTMFHYSDDVSGNAKVSVQPYYAGKGYADNMKARFTVMDGETVRFQTPEIPFVNEEAACTYPVNDDVFPEKGKKYILKIEVYSSGKVEASYSQSLYKYDRPRFLDEEGNFRNAENEIVPPVAAYHLNEKDYKTAVAAGITMFQIPNGKKAENAEIIKENLRMTEKSGLYGLFSLYNDMKNAAHDDNIENTKLLVEALKDERSFVGWLVQDEPLGGGITEEKKALLELAYKTIRDIDPNHPIIIAENNPAVFKETAKYCDIFIPNAYTRNLIGVRGYTEEAVLRANGRPVYTNVAIYANGNGTEAELPTGKQIKHNIYQAFSGGAKGISFFSFSDAITKSAHNPEKIKVPIYKTEAWETFYDTCRVEMPSLFDLFVYGDEKPEEVKTETYIEKKWTRTDGVYYFLLSTSSEDRMIEYNVPENTCVTLLGGDADEEFNLSDGKLNVSLRGGGALLFKVYDGTDCIRAEKNGIGIKKTEPGEIQITAPAGTEQLVLCLYEKNDGRDVLIRMETAETNVMSFYVDMTEKWYDMKVFAWDEAMRPKTSAVRIQGH